MSTSSNRFPPVALYDGDPTGVACTVPNSIVQSTTTGDLYSCLGGVYVPIGGGGATGLTLGYTVSSGAPATGVGPLLLAPHAGTLSRCIVATKASDPATDFSFQVLKNGTAIFASAPSVAHGTANGTKNTFTVTPSLTVAQDDLFSLTILTGTATWSVTIQVE